MKKLLALVLLIAAVGCTDTKNTLRVLEDQGYTEVTITGYRAFTCGDDYTFSTGFKAKAPVTHRSITGVVCSGMLKGNSIKLD